MTEGGPCRPSRVIIIRVLQETRSHGWWALREGTEAGCRSGREFYSTLLIVSTRSSMLMLVHRTATFRHLCAGTHYCCRQAVPFSPRNQRKNQVS